MKDKKIILSEKDLHIIDVYSKKNLNDTMPQFGNPGENQGRPVAEMSNINKEQIDGFR